jgi:hypothetical protein
MLPATLQFFIVMIASAINDRLQRKRDYVEEERRILWEQVEALTGGKKISFTPDQHWRLATAGKLLTGHTGPCRRKSRLPVIGFTAANATSHAGGTTWRRSSKLLRGDLDWRVFSTRDRIGSQREDLAHHGGLM